MSDLTTALDRGEEYLNELRERHGLEPRGYEQGDPPTDEQFMQYVEALEATVVGLSGGLIRGR